MHTITFLDGAHIKYLPPNKAYERIGFHFNTMLDFIEHFTHITKEVKKTGERLT